MCDAGGFLPQKLFKDSSPRKRLYFFFIRRLRLAACFFSSLLNSPYSSQLNLYSQHCSLNNVLGCAINWPSVASTGWHPCNQRSVVVLSWGSAILWLNRLWRKVLPCKNCIWKRSGRDWFGCALMQCGIGVLSSALSFLLGVLSSALVDKLGCAKVRLVQFYVLACLQEVGDRWMGVEHVSLSEGVGSIFWDLTRGALWR